MRVVAGSVRGRRLVAPAGTDVRPTGDRVREAVFNALGSMGALHDATVLDLFAGSGALGIEALSRGARHASFVDSSRASLEAVHLNLEACRLADRATVVRADALGWVQRTTPAADLALLDPPYAFDRWDELLGALRVDLAVVESDRDIAVPHGWRVLRHRRYGGTVVTIVETLDRDEHGRTASEDRS